MAVLGFSLRQPIRGVHALKTMQYGLSDHYFCNSKSGKNLLEAKAVIQARNYGVTPEGQQWTLWKLNTFVMYFSSKFYGSWWIRCCGQGEHLVGNDISMRAESHYRDGFHYCILWTLPMSPGSSHQKACSSKLGVFSRNLLYRAIFISVSNDTTS